MRSMVFKCPRTAVDVILNLSVHDRTQLLLKMCRFAFPCNCCGELHLWRMRDAVHIRRPLAIGPF